MKTSTVSLFGIPNGNSPAPRGAISAGIATTEFGEDKVPQVHLGETGYNRRFAFVSVAKAGNTPKIVGNLLTEAFPVESEVKA